MCNLSTFLSTVAQADHLLIWLFFRVLFILSGRAVLLGVSELSKDARQTHPPEYLEGLRKQLDETKTAGLIVL